MAHKHEKVTTYVKQPDNSIKIQAKSYYDELSHIVEEIEKPHTNISELQARAIIDTATDRVLSGESQQTVITIKKTNGKLKILERYITLKQDIGKF